MSVRNAAAGNINMLAAQIQAEAEGFDAIGERGIGDRMKRSAAEIRLAADLLRNYDGPSAYDIANGFADEALAAIIDPEPTPEPVAKFTVGQKVRTTAGNLIYPVGTEFVVTEVVQRKSPFAGGNYYVNGDQYGYGVWENHAEAVPEPLAAWEKELLGIKDEKPSLKFSVGDKVKVVNDDEMSGHLVGTLGEIVDIDPDDTMLVYAVQAENTNGWESRMWHTEDALELVTEPEAKVLVVPSRVRVLSTNNTESNYTTPYIGQLGTVISVGQPYVQVQLDSGRFLYLSKAEFEVI